MTATIQQFPLEPKNGFVALLTRFMALLVVVGGWAILLLFIAGMASQFTAAVLGLFILLFPVAFLWNIRRAYRGAAELHPDRLLVRTPAVTHSYPWQHIRQIEVIRIRDTGAMSRALYQVFGVNLDQRLVRLRLRRSLRQGLISSRLGTDFIGIPAPGMKAVGLFLQDPDSFADAAVPYLQAAGSYRP